MSPVTASLADLRLGFARLACLWLACGSLACDPSGTKALKGDGGNGGSTSTTGRGGSSGSGGNASATDANTTNNSDASNGTGGSAGSNGTTNSSDGPSPAIDGGGGFTPSGPTDGGGAAGIPPGAPLGLPMVVTDNFENRGWFGDPAVAATFNAGSIMIREVAAITGPCATRPTGAQGKCLKFTYTPPPGLMASPTGGFVGDMFLRSLAFYHPEVNPTPRPGQANWGWEPGVALAPGATQVSFYAAADQPGVAVSFRAGIDRDAFALPDLTTTLDTTWKLLSLPLAGAKYDWNLFGPFGWLLKDPTKPATFYVDSIVWEGTGAAPSPPAGPAPTVPNPPAVPPTPGAPRSPPPPAGKKDGVRQLTIINQCKKTVWLGAYGDPTPEGGGLQLDAGQKSTITLPGGKWTGRFWGRTGCRFDANGIGGCDTGSCGAREKCAGATGEPPATLVEFTLSGGGADPDFYDISLVDGYNLPMAVAPLPGTFTGGGGGNDCGAPSCASDLNTTCPSELHFTDAAANVVACLSACERFRTDEFCCANAHNTTATCPAFPYSKIFKAACPAAYSYAYDDASSTFTCHGEDYAIWFCP